MTSESDPLRAYDERMRTPPPTPPAGIRYDQDGPVLRSVGRRRGTVSTPRDLGVYGAELDRLITRQRDYFAARGEAVECKVHGHDLPVDLPERLRVADFVPREQDTIVIGRAEDMTSYPVLPDGVVVRQTTADADMYRIAAIESAVWGQDWGILGYDLIARVAAAPDEIAVMLAEADGEVVSAAWLVLLGAGAAGLWGGATVAEWRGYGIYRALVAARAELALTNGVQFLQADASADSAPILSGLGFHAVTTATGYVWSPPSRPWHAGLT